MTHGRSLAYYSKETLYNETVLCILAVLIMDKRRKCRGDGFYGKNKWIYKAAAPPPGCNKLTIHKRPRFATSVVDSPPVTIECLFHMIQWIPLKIRAPQGAIFHEM
jgi:hypothetical protein